MKYLSLLAFVVVVPACTDAWSSTGTTEHASVAEHASGGEDHDHDEPHVAPEAAARVLVLDSTAVGRPVEVIGLVDVHEPVHTTEEALGELREHAAAMGADAVIGVEFRHPDHEAGPTHLSGMAVRFRDLLRGRAYDVLGPIDVREAMGHHDDAMGRLRARAGEMHADLIIDIHYAHGDAESPTSELHGTAIRLR